MRLPWAAPDYDGACLTGLLPSVVGSVLRGPRRLPIPDADRIVVLLVDGLGHHVMPQARNETRFLAQMQALLPEGLDSAFPSTTATSLASFGTGLVPGAHGLVGASFWLPERDDVLSALAWRDKPNPLVIQPEPTVLQTAAAAGVAVTVVGPRSFAGTGLTSAALRGGRYLGADSPGEVVTAVAAAATAPPPAIVYGYFSTPDKSGHVHGVGSEPWLLDMWHTDRTIEQIARRLGKGPLLVVTGDHGMINCPDRARVNIDGERFRSGVRRIAGEPRMRHVYTRRGIDPKDVARRWQSLLEGSAVVLTRAEAIELGLFGAVAVGIADRIGDVLAIATADFALVSAKVDSIVSGLRGQHGGLTDPERKVPLLAWTAP